MSGVTGIEFGPDYCVLVAARKRGSAIEIGAVRLLESAEWTDDPALQSLRLQEARSELSLPRQATAIVWHQARSASRHSPESVLGAAGFNVGAVVAPIDALALLASSRTAKQGEGPVAWLSINHHGAAIAVIRDGAILYSRELSWRIQASEQRVQAHLLRRYLYTAQLTPELRRARQAVEEQSGASIQSAIVCGNVSDLRSLTMPLIGEFDIEFEPLDSMEGLIASGPAAATVPQAAATIRLASTAAMRSESVPNRAFTTWLAAAGGLILAAGAAWWAYSLWAPSRPSAIARISQPPASARSAEPSGTAGSTPVPPKSAGGASTSGRTPAPLESPSLTQSTPKPQPSIGVSGSERPDGGSSRTGEEPVPSVGGVLISSDRRLAVVDGAVVGVGDRVGQWVVARIDLEAVVLRESSGRQIRVPTRTKSGT